MDLDIQGNRIKLRHLQCFIAVAQLHSLQKASEALSITQPAVSKTLAELETATGTRLFERGRKGAELTDQGRMFAPYANAALSALQEGVQKLQGGSHRVPSIVRVGILPTLARVLFPSALAAFRRSFVAVSIEVHTGHNLELLRSLKAAEVDFVVGRLGEPSSMTGMSFEHLFREPLTIVVRAGHPILRGPITASTLASYDLVLPPIGTLIRQSADSVLAALGAPERASVISSLSVSLNLQLTLHNEAIWFVPASLVESYVIDGELMRVPMPAGGTDEPIGLLRRTDVALSSHGAALFEAFKAAGMEQNRRRSA
ncbi:MULTISPECIES: LysR substrate-binding domain-containing protein [Achromobacter]|uniref:LysR family transcriptional regulator n=1 Tax=Achromobacter spanius TaxID=217203 RepID=A0AAW3HXJ2_9BURK|nr:MULTISPECIES: LysR substrate-binding domain-containing protein [Achromobacter]KNE24576.1 LysR family transcriptional regulator [Achromobacter spanius]MCD0500917.1 LysR substrate-binding domain-containing protein [Achromobacter sp. MY14]